ncbi:uncharacterized protein C8Q71DRAFT_771196 [Rhodofomes roseus]|uniref:Transmembrane protein n=1 Tax=Rhodofomes roseus TaxID=34475 RepID=A0ABQ8K9T5_9APHY|nr:uncharacterized protein C8Q71DRAFT_771196 [Rhodofomes roseus]KAH9834115.1 hypothetical protein C8Q71DRAFT_771196 [Rhodofomes roseus]
MTHNPHGKSFFRETRRMTEEPRSMKSASSPFLLMEPAVLRTLTTSKSTTDVRATHNGRPVYDAGAPNGPAEHPIRNWTQTDQDETDAQRRKDIMKELMKSWMDRLQLISVITTFFAATEGQLLVITTPADDNSPETRIRATANAILAGALVIHLCAAIISFLAAFFLVRYRLKEATKEEIKIETGITPASSHPDLKTGIWSTNPHLEEMGPFRGGPPTRLLEHLHTLCMWLALVGFALALAGALCYTWARLSLSASVFATACLGVAWFAAIGAVVVTIK